MVETGSIASFRQQAGRAGRREQQSMSIYVAFDGPLDQYFMTFPRNLFDKPIEGAHVRGQTELPATDSHHCIAPDFRSVMAHCP